MYELSEYAYILPPKRRLSGPISSMGRCQPDDHRIQDLPTGTHAFDSSDCCSLDTRAAVTRIVTRTDEHFDPVQIGKHNASLTHVVDILLQQNRGVLQHRSGYVKPISGFIIDVETIPV